MLKAEYQSERRGWAAKAKAFSLLSPGKRVVSTAGGDREDHDQTFENVTDSSKDHNGAKEDHPSKLADPGAVGSPDGAGLFREKHRPIGCCGGRGADGNNHAPSSNPVKGDNHSELITCLEQNGEDGSEGYRALSQSRVLRKLGWTEPPSPAFSSVPSSSCSETENGENSGFANWFESDVTDRKSWSRFTEAILEAKASVTSAKGFFSDDSEWSADEDAHEGTICEFDVEMEVNGMLVRNQCADSCTDTKVQLSPSLVRRVQEVEEKLERVELSKPFFAASGAEDTREEVDMEEKDRHGLLSMDIRRYDGFFSPQL
ncbi:unnamed protein product [Discosporangium mesarthrocarpum]